MGWLFYTDRRVQRYADEKAEITRLCTFETDTRRTTLVKASKVGSTWYAAAKVESLDGASLEDRTYIIDDDGSFTFGAVFLTRMTPVNAGRQGYRTVRLRLTEPTWLGSLALGGCSDQPDKNQMNRGTIASRRWSGENAAVVGENETVDFEVSRMPDTGSEASGAITFALAVTISMPTVNEIYQQVKERVRPELRQRL